MSRLFSSTTRVLNKFTLEQFPKGTKFWGPNVTYNPLFRHYLRVYSAPKESLPLAEREYIDKVQKEFGPLADIVTVELTEDQTVVMVGDARHVFFPKAKVSDLKNFYLLLDTDKPLGA